jgi:hypothetical protein
MPLSEQEQRLLEEMERSLYHNDADFVATVGNRRVRTNYRSVVVGIIVGIVGIAVTVTGVVSHIAVVGIAGFVVMFAGVLIAVSAPRGSLGAAPAEHPRARKVGFMDRMNDRWEKRQDERDQ